MVISKSKGFELQRFILGVSVFGGYLSLVLINENTLAATESNQKKHGEVIYGEDNRKDMFEVTDPFIWNLAQTTVALFPKRGVKISGDLAFLKTVSFGESENLCLDEPYYEQDSGAFCTGVLIGPELVLTAGHCIETDKACEKTAFIFNFALKSQSQENLTSVEANQVYSCKKLEREKIEFDGADYALVHLDRVVFDRIPAQMNLTSIPIKEKTPLLLFGYPNGLPLKYADGAYVRNSSNPKVFITNTDSYTGNSGGPIFNSQTGLLEGILVRGETDFIFDDEKMCFRSQHCELDQCRGEEVIPVSAIFK